MPYIPIERSENPISMALIPILKEEASYLSGIRIIWTYFSQQEHQLLINNIKTKHISV